MKYLFILGRNVELSLAEVFSYFEKEGNKILNYDIEKNAILLDLEKPIEKIIQHFGGVISIGEVLGFGTPQAYPEKSSATLKSVPLEKKDFSTKGKISTKGKDLISELEKQELYFGEKNKFNYCVWNFADESIDEISGYLKKRFRGEKLKATQKTFVDKIELQAGGKAQKITSKLINEEFFLFGEKKGESRFSSDCMKKIAQPQRKGGFDKGKLGSLYFGRIIQKCDYNELEKRDMSRPVRRESLSISPRLAKIMINLSQVRKDEKLLDPFCGVGVILQEALLQEIEAVGIDINKEAIWGARKNLEYQNFSQENYKLIVGDSSRIQIGKVNVLVAEPDLGDTLKKIPTKEKAQKMLNNYEDLMIEVLGNLSNLVLGKIVFTAPFIRIGKKRLSCNIYKILEKTNLKLSTINDVKFPIPEFRGNQIVGREIFVLE